MRNLFLIATLLISSAAFASTVDLPNLGKSATGTNNGGKYSMDVNLTGGTVTATNPSVSSTGAAVPASGTYIGGSKAGNLTGLLIGQQTMANSLACVLPSDQSAIPVSESGAWNITNITGTISLPTNASTSALQTAGNTTLSTISGQLPSALGQTTMAGSLAVAIASNQSAIPASQSGTWTVQPGNTANTTPWLVKLNDGTTSFAVKAASTAAVATDPAVVVAISPNNTIASTQSGTWNMRLQDGAGSAVNKGQTTMTGSLPVTIASDQTAVPASQSGTWNMRLQDGAGSAVNKGQGTMAASLPVAISSDQSALSVKLQDGSGSAVNKGSATSAGSLPVVIASDQAAVQVKAPLSATGSGSAASATVSTVITLSAPANAVGFILQNLDTSTANIRWAVGRTATTALGQQLQPGRDTGFVPVGANVSLVAESGTQNYDIQWISQ